MQDRGLEGFAVQLQIPLCRKRLFFSFTSTLLSSLLTLLFCLLLPGCHSVAPPLPLDKLNPQQVRGHAIFQSRCARCHYDRVDEPRNGPALLGLLKKPHLPSGAPANDDRVTATILHGRNLMPAQPIDPNDLDDLLAYLHTL